MAVETAPPIPKLMLITNLAPAFIPTLTPIKFTTINTLPRTQYLKLPYFRPTSQLETAGFVGIGVT